MFVIVLLLTIAALAIGYALFVLRIDLRGLIRKAIGDFEMSVSASFRLYSQRLNAFATLVVLPYIISTNGGFVAQAFNALPEAYRIIAAPFAGMVAFAVVTWARLRIQPAKPHA